MTDQLDGLADTQAWRNLARTVERLHEQARRSMVTISRMWMEQLRGIRAAMRRAGAPHSLRYGHTAGRASSPARRRALCDVCNRHGNPPKSPAANRAYTQRQRNRRGRR